MRAQEEGEAEAIDAWFINSSVFVVVVDKEGLTSTGDARFCHYQRLSSSKVRSAVCLQTRPFLGKRNGNVCMNKLKVAIEIIFENLGVII